MNTIELLKRHEGFSATVYTDTRGVATIGFGQTIDSLVIDQELGSTLLESRVAVLTRQLATLPVFRELDQVRLGVIVNMAYQMGFAGVLEFSKMWNALEAREYPAASAAMLASRWAVETPGRARELATMMESGQWPS